jgi:hypothetical protein
LAEDVFDAPARRAAALRPDAERVDFLFDRVRRGVDLTMEPRTGMRPAPNDPAAGADARARVGGPAAGASAGRLPSMSRFKLQLDKPKDGFGPCRFVALFSCPGVHHFHAVRRKDGWSLRHLPGGATAFLCTNARPYASFSFHLHHLPTQRRSSIPAKEGGGDPGTSRSVCPMGCSCPMCRTRLRTLSTAVSQSDFSERPEARASARSARTS